LDHYNLDMIIAVGYRVKSRVATKFRQWATARLHEYLVKGFTLDDERLKGGSGLVDYLDAEEIDIHNRITVMFLDQAEFRARRRQNIRMGDWEAFLEKFLCDTELPVLEDAGEVSHEAAIDWAHTQYDAFAERRRSKEESEAETRYVKDLENSAKMLEQKRKIPDNERDREK